jgi:hypothetical protein
VRSLLSMIFPSPTMKSKTIIQKALKQLHTLSEKTRRIAKRRRLSFSNEKYKTTEKEGDDHKAEANRLFAKELQTTLLTYARRYGFSTRPQQRNLQGQLHVALLDASTMRSSRTVSKLGFSKENIHVPNCCADLTVVGRSSDIAQVYLAPWGNSGLPSSLGKDWHKIFANSSFLENMSQKLPFIGAFYDACSNIKTCAPAINETFQKLNFTDTACFAVTTTWRNSNVCWNEGNVVIDVVQKAAKANGYSATLRYRTGTQTFPTFIFRLVADVEKPIRRLPSPRQAKSFALAQLLTQ